MKCQWDNKNKNTMCVKKKKTYRIEKLERCVVNFSVSLILEWRDNNSCCDLKWLLITH